VSSRLRFLISIVALFGAASVWAGEAGPVKGQFYIHPMLTYYNPPSKLGYDNYDIAPGIVLGWSFLDNWAMEASYVEFQPDLKDPPGGKGDIWSWGANVMYLMPGAKYFTPYVTIGGGRGDYQRDSIGKDSTQNEYNFGVGTYVGDSQRLAFRADIRGLYTLDAEKLEPWASVGVVFKFGRIEEPKPLDSDGDGVPDPKDACPNTPPGRKVGPDGCEFDQDKDGVVDGADACPNTPIGVQVDSRGFPLDSDGDGVPDYLDKCPNTPHGTKVDEHGCPIVAETNFNLTVEFAFGSAEINDLSFRELRNAMTFLRDNPTTKARIEGHTDNVGSAAYNMKLSQRRAAAVVDVLVKSGIEADRLTPEGFGLTQPIATNDTAEGRAQNRRVTIVVGAGGKK